MHAITVLTSAHFVQSSESDFLINKCDEPGESLKLSRFENISTAQSSVSPNYRYGKKKTETKI